METKRQVFADAIKYLTNVAIVDKEEWFWRYDNADDASIPTKLTTTIFSKEPLRPSVHEIAMRLLSADWACSNDGPNTSPQQCYMMAEMLYNAGTEWELNSKDNK